MSSLDFNRSAESTSAT